MQMFPVQQCIILKALASMIRVGKQQFLAIIPILNEVKDLILKLSHYLKFFPLDKSMFFHESLSSGEIELWNSATIRC